MALCPDDNDVYKAAASALGAENVETVKTSGNTVSPEILNAYRQKYLQREATIDELSNAVAAGAPTGEILRPQDARAISAQSKFVASLIDKNDSYRQNKLDMQEEAKKTAAGLTRAEESKWLHIVFGINKKFINERADLSEWAWNYGNDPRYNTPSAQPLIQIIDGARPLIRANNNKFAERQIKLKERLIPIAKRTGQDISVLYHDMGIYANARHILNDNVNGWLLDKWKTQRENIRAKLITAINHPDKKISPKYIQNLQRDYNRLERIIPYLEQNLENPVKPDGLVSAGYTNRQARDLMDHILQKTGATKEEADAFSVAVTEEFNYITQERAKAGLISSHQLDAFPDFQNYVALMSANDNFTGPVNEAARYMQGSMHSREGMTADPQSAAVSLAQYGQRSATEIGAQRLATHLYELSEINRVGRDIGNEDNGLRSKSYNKLIKEKYSGVPELQEKATDILNGGGLVVEVLKRDAKSGEIESERRYVYFEPGWSGKGHMKNINGMKLNQALTSDYKTESSLVQWAGKLSSLHGQMFTRFSIGFPLIGGTRDGMERVTHMTNRAYFTDDGRKINNWQLIRQYIYNTPRAMSIVAEVFTRSPDKWSEAASRWWNEFTSNGLLQIVTPGVKPEGRSLTDVLNNTQKGTLVGRVADITGANFLNKWTASLGPLGRRAIDIVDKWNNAWQNAAAFSQFMVFREAGMSPARAAEHVLEPMNMSQKGTLTPYLRILSPFVQPTMQSAGALARTLGFTVNAKNPMDILKAGRNGWAGVALVAGAYAILGPLMREAMGIDEAGKKRFDYTPLRDVVSYFPVGPLDDKGTFLKLPVGFGISRLGGLLAIGTQRVMQGLMEPADVVAEMIFTTAKDIIPATMPTYKFTDKPGAFIMQLLTPDALKPIMEVYGDTSYYGYSIANAPREGVARADQGRSSTDPFFHKLARMALQYGVTDQPPEYYKHLMQGYGVGPLRVFGAIFDMINGGSSVTSNKYDPDGYDGIAPWLQAIGASMWISRPRDTLRGMFYDYKRELNSRIERAGLKLTLPENAGKKIDAAAYRRKILEDSGIFTSEEIEDYELIRNVDSQFRAINDEFNNKYREAWLQQESVDDVKEWFKRDHEIKTEILKNFVQNANYYRNRPQ